MFVHHAFVRNSCPKFRKKFSPNFSEIRFLVMFSYSLSRTFFALTTVDAEMFRSAAIMSLVTMSASFPAIHANTFNTWANATLSLE